MLIAYESRTGNVARFVNKLNMRCLRIDENITLSEPFVLVTYTSGFGQVPDKTAAFLKRNSRFLRGVAASGNRNWGDGFAKSADRISEQYHVPVLGKFELSGTRKEADHFVREVESVALLGTEQSADAARSGRILPAHQR
ncbi:MAG: NrdI protein [Paenibacillaceae bacterium]|nr:NrdI protein [Paenibacillaceae bacterium]